MQLDQTLFSQSKANDSLEKPFDSETLRGLVEKYVPRTKNFPLKGLLNHPDLPDFVESDSFIRQKSEHSKSNQPTKIDIPIFESSELADDEVDDFSEVELKSTNQQPRQEPDDWSASSAEKFVVETESFGDFEEVKVTLNNESKSTPNFQQRIHEQIQNYIQDSTVAKSKAQTVTPKSLTSLDEQLMKEEVRMMAEKICWQILPEITERIVREELAKLLQGLDKI